jgi:hypothetical protein
MKERFLWCGISIVHVEGSGVAEAPTDENNTPEELLNVS